MQGDRNSELGALDWDRFHTGMRVVEGCRPQPATRLGRFETTAMESDDGCFCLSDCALRDPQHFCHCGRAINDLLKSIFAQCHHSTFDAHTSQLGDVGVAGDFVAKIVVEYQYFVEA